MSEEIQAWKPEDAVAKLKERIRLEFAQMIPPEQFAAMVRNVIKEFLEQKSTGYVQRDRISSFDSVVTGELTEATKEEVKKILASDEWRAKWDSNAQKNGVSDAISQIMVKAGPTILNNWLAQAMQQVILQMQHNR